MRDCKTPLLFPLSGVQWTTLMCHTAFIHPFYDILHHTARVGSLLESSEDLLLSKLKLTSYTGSTCYSNELHHSCQEPH